MFHIEGCPIHEELLHLIPRSLRDEFHNIYGIRIEGDLCPVCRYRLKEEFNNDYTAMPITQSSFRFEVGEGSVLSLRWMPTVRM